MHVRSPEQNPAQTDHMERDQHAQNPPPRPHLLSGSLEHRGESVHQRLMNGQRGSVQRPPQDESDGRSVPQPAQQHRQHQVRIRPRAPLAVPAQRNVKVVLQPARQRDMPAPPELGDRSRLVGRIEVDREPEAEQQGQPDRHIGVSREVAVNLQGVPVNPHQVLEAAVQHGVVEYPVDEVQADIVRDDRFLEQARQDQKDSASEHVARNENGIPVNLRQKVPGPDDRTRHELRKERQVEQVVDPAPHGLDLPAVQIDHVAHRLEREERDADGQENVRQRQRPVDQPGYGRDDQVGILEIAQQAQIDQQAQHEQALSRSGTPGAVYQPSDREVRQRQPDEQQEEQPARLVVEIEREQRDIDDPQHETPFQQAVDQREPEKNEQEQAARKKHRATRIVAEKIDRLTDV